MQLKTSIIDGKSNDTDKAETTSVDLSDVIPNTRAKIPMVQSILVIWLDENIDNKNEGCQNTISQLHGVVNGINIFTDDEQCIQFLTSVNATEICMIISDSFSQYIVPRIHNMSQVISIFIFCNNKTSHVQWTKKWSNIKGIFTETTLMCDALKQVAQEYEENSISISFMGTNDKDGISKKKLDKLEPSFMYTQLMKEILMTIEFQEKQFNQFIDYCHEVLAGNTSQLQNVEELKQKYRQETPIWWYTYECFLYPIVNCALRILDADLIIMLGFFIKDLHLQVEQLHNEQFYNMNMYENFLVYRGQGMVKQEFEKMMQTRGRLLSFNCFLSTSTRREVSLRFARREMTNPDLIGILFVITINPAQSTIPFAAIGNVSYFRNQEEEVLFSMHTIFRIKDIIPIYDNQRLFQVDLILTSDNDPDLRVLTARIQEETFPNREGWYRLSHVLLKMGQFKKADAIHQILLEQAITEVQKASIYDQIGWSKWEEAITYYEKSLEIYKEILPPNHPDLATFYNNMAGVDFRIGEYSKALFSYEKALHIQKQSLPPNDPYLAMSYSNIGSVYFHMSEYSKALLCHKKALAIRQQSLPPYHPDLAMSYNNIALVYDDTYECLKAIEFHEKAIEIKQHLLPANHPDLALSYFNIGLVYFKIGEYSETRSFL